MQEVVIKQPIEIMFDDLIVGDMFIFENKAYVCMPDIEEKTNVYFNAVNLSSKERSYFDPDNTVYKVNRIILEL